MQLMIKPFLGLYFLLGPVSPGAPVAQWVKRFPTDLAVRVGSSLEAKSAFLNGVQLHTAFYYQPPVEKDVKSCQRIFFSILRCVDAFHASPVLPPFLQGM